MSSVVSERQGKAPVIALPVKPSPGDPIPEHCPRYLVISRAGFEREWLSACVGKLDGRSQIVCSEPDGWLTDAYDPTPSLILLDLDASRVGRVVSVATLAQAFPDAPLAALCSVTEDGFIEEVLSAGAMAYIPRAYSETQVLQVLRLVLDGVAHRPVLKGKHALTLTDCAGGAELRGTQTSQVVEALPQYRLTHKQVEVLALATEGLTNAQIADRLKIAEGTVKVHMSAIYSKLHVDHRAGAVVMARRMEEIRAQQIHEAERGNRVLDWLLPHVTHRRMRKGQLIFRKGDLGAELYYIQRGTVGLTEIDVDMGEGEILGEIGIFSPQRRRTWSACCKTDVDLFCLGSEQVKSIYYLNPTFALHVVQLIAQRLLADRERGR